ncbi:type II toxin -antitoxin system TacA 1-like antitoxin [Photorhabdus luminescens]|nr:DUF1778 domain-containing protein [Photorhabdus luminescens]
MATLANERIIIRVSSETKELLEKALLLSRDASLDNFIANAAVAEAKNLLNKICVFDCTKKMHWRLFMHWKDQSR